jgi:hypothetical protein
MSKEDLLSEIVAVLTSHPGLLGSVEGFYLVVISAQVPPDVTGREALPGLLMFTGGKSKRAVRMAGCIARLVKDAIIEAIGREGIEMEWGEM